MTVPNAIPQLTARQISTTVFLYRTSSTGRPSADFQRTLLRWQAASACQAHPAQTAGIPTNPNFFRALNGIGRADGMWRGRHSVDKCYWKSVSATDSTFALVSTGRPAPVDSVPRSSPALSQPMLPMGFGYTDAHDYQRATARPPCLPPSIRARRRDCRPMQTPTALSGVLAFPGHIEANVPHTGVSAAWSGRADSCCRARRRSAVCRRQAGAADAEKSQGATAQN